MKSYKEVEQRIDKLYKDTGKHQKILNYLGDRNKLFWDCINLIHFVSLIDHQNEPSEIKYAKVDICAKFLNNSVGCYKMLCEGLENEFLMLLRQSREVSYLLPYFVKNPKEIKGWMSGKNKGYIAPAARRKSIDNGENLGVQYTNLSAFTHSKTDSIGISFIGGVFDPDFIDDAFLNLLGSIIDMLNYLYKSIEKFSEITIEDYELKSISENEKSSFKESVILSLQQFESIAGDFIELACKSYPDTMKGILRKNNDDEYLEYLNNLGL